MEMAFIWLLQLLSQKGILEMEMTAHIMYLVRELCLGDSIGCFSLLEK